MRFDRFITLNLVQPFRRTSGSELPVLMYHSICDDAESETHPYYRVCTSPQRFREQMQWLKGNGYRGVTLSAALGSNSKIGNRKSEIGNPIVLTFDDGFQDFYTTAWPVLQEFGFTATMFLPTAFIGDTRRRFSTGRACLTWNEVEELHCAGIEFGSHTVNHPKLTELSWPEIQSEIHDSKSAIENQLGVPCRAFAYPYAFPQANGDFVKQFCDTLLENGYQTNVTTLIGRHRSGDDLLQIKRLPVNSDDDAKLFQAKLNGAYDWIASLQAGVKKMKSAISSNSKTKGGVSTGQRIAAAK